LTPEEFEQLIAQREGEMLDFKQEMPSSSDLAKLVTAFYNTRGGTIGSEPQKLDTWLSKIVLYYQAERGFT